MSIAQENFVLRSTSHYLPFAIIKGAIFVKLLTALFVFTQMTINLAIAGDIQKLIIPPCESQGCYVVAKKITLPEAIDANNLKIRIGSLVVTIPPDVTRIDLFKSVTIFNYDTTPNIMISTETDETFPLTKSASKFISLSEAMEIIFTKTPKDRDLTGKYDNDLLSKLMLVKQGLMDKSNKAYVYDKGRIKIYYAPKGGDPHKNFAWAIDSKYPNVAIRLESDLHQNDFIKMLYSIALFKAREKKLCH